MLVSDGYPLYSEIYNDQPPLFTYVLAAGFNVFGSDVNIGRTLVLIFSSVLLWACYQFLRTNWGEWHALAGALLIFLLPYYTSLSVSAMIGLPSLTFACLAILALSTWHRTDKNRWLMLSAVALSLSMLTKVITGFLAPVIIVGILAVKWAGTGKKATWQDIVSPAVIWGLVFTGFTSGLALILVGPAHTGQLLGIHLAARQMETYVAFQQAHPISWYLRESWAFILLAVPGGFLLVHARKWVSLYLVIWTVAAFVLLSFHTPVWYHHQLLVTLPVAMLAGVAAGEAFLYFTRLIGKRTSLNMQALLFVTAVAGFALVMATRAHPLYLDFRRPAYRIEPAAQPAAREYDFLAEIIQRAPTTNWMITDLPMYAFRAGLPVPPALAVISEKRISTGELSEDVIIALVDAYKPEQVLIGRFNFPALETYLSKDYGLAHTLGRRNLFVLCRLLGLPAPCALPIE
jgi:4-amino-4-deoxy-L-arabinose transferase-like glycosyltransferase